MVARQHYRWDFIGLSTDNKPTPATSEKVVDGSTFYCSDNSKLYVWYNDQWYEKVVSGGGGGGTNNFNVLDNRPKYKGVLMSGDTDIPEVITYTAGDNITITNGEISATDTTYSNFTGTDGSSTGAAGLVPAPVATDAGKFLKADGTWDTAGGGSGPTVVQTTGTSTTDVMSQNAVTQAIFASGYDPATSQTDIRVQIGGSTTAAKNAISIGQGAQSSGYGSVAIGVSSNARGGNSICIGRGSSSSQNAIQGDVVLGNGASATNDSSVVIGNDTKGYQEVVSIGHTANASAVASTACGQNSTASGAGSIALGAWANSSNQGEMNIGSMQTYYGYNNSNYRLLTGLYDGQSAHDAATVGQITPTTDSSAPTTATAGRLGEIRIDTTTNTAYMCVLSDSATPTYEWKQITA